LKGTLQALANHTFIARFTELSAYILPAAAGQNCSLMELQKKFDGFLSAYLTWAEWCQRSFLVTDRDISNNRPFLEWDKCDDTFLIELKKVGAIASLSWLGNQARGRSSQTLRIRDKTI